MKKISKTSRLMALLAFVSFAFVSCNMNEQEVNDQCSSGVVLIKNTGYYELQLPSGLSAYFTSYSEDGGLDNLTFSSDEIVTYTSFGTGFFISEDGRIATNNHVVGSEFSNKKVNKAMKSILEKVKSSLASKYNELCELEGELDEQIKAKWMRNMDYSEEVALKRQIAAKKEQYADNYNTFSKIKVSGAELKHHCEISIAYNETYVTNSRDFIPCVVKATDALHDLAIIQLKDKQTPAGKYVFTIPDEDPVENYSFMETITKTVGTDKNQKVILIGFNKGMALANTTDGIKSQYTVGNISQKDDNQMMYTIPSLPGSSGSPVLNLRGELVAVNYAGISSTQSFNYGVRINYLRNLAAQ